MSHLHHKVSALVDGELHVERGGQGKCLEHDRQRQNLDERVPASPQLRPEHRQRQPRALVSRNKSFGGRELESDSGEVL